MNQEALNYCRGFASRMCLILERYLKIPNYKLPTEHALHEMIEFFELCQGREVFSEKLDVTVVNRTLPEAVFKRLLSQGYKLVCLEPEAYPSAASMTVFRLMKRPGQVSWDAKHSLYKFFETVEEEMDFRIKALAA